ncbi:unnamed protein product [Parascedosporium putredinis]|uniref:Uncharacterized protein n=1 Tax=Parascedosporium putredinis TaxID=1442378 RepID=A0A9P1GX46_9PEZI|nr:unnamed protein product [Parascedosporium putredinis]CAI7990204.1 unnamed protein product [Parascedosporium putredinis]
MRRSPSPSQELVRTDQHCTATSHLPKRTRRQRIETEHGRESVRQGFENKHPELASEAFHPKIPSEHHGLPDDEPRAPNHGLPTPERLRHQLQHPHLRRFPRGLGQIVPRGRRRGNTLILGAASSCFPTALGSYLMGDDYLETMAVFSPGNLCPIGFTTACSVVRGDPEPTTDGILTTASWAIWNMLDEGETAFNCCPRSFGCAEDDALKCTFTGSRGARVSGIMYEDECETKPTTLTRRPHEANRRGGSETGRASASVTGRASSLPTPSGGLTTGAKVAIALGVTIPLLFVATAVITLTCIFKRRRKARAAHLAQIPNYPQPGQSGYYYVGGPGVPVPVPGGVVAAKPELEGTPKLGNTALAGQQPLPPQMYPPQSSTPSSSGDGGGVAQQYQQQQQQQQQAPLHGQQLSGVPEHVRSELVGSAVHGGPAVNTHPNT